MLPLSLFLLLTLSQGPLADPGSEAIGIRSVLPDKRLRLQDGSSVRLQGLWDPLPGPSRPWSAARTSVSSAIETPGDAGLLFDAKGRCLNEAWLEQGLAFFHTRTRGSHRQAALLAASERARLAGRGVWARGPQRKGKPPLQRGAVLGLYYKEARFDYHRQIDQVVELGADWLCLLATCFVDKVDSNEIDFDPSRTVGRERFLETCRYARKKGLRLKLLPIVLIRDAGEDDWRGTLRPSDPGRFWLSYDRFLGRWCDLAREGGIEMLSVGSELCSLERSKEAWQRVIDNARGRYGGWLTYSVNWDHYDVPGFWGRLDQVGMTAYFELTEDRDAPYAKLVEGWHRVRRDLEKASKRLGRKIVLTELGYPSQDGGNTKPWNYYINPEKLDLEEQKDCFRAFIEVMADAPFLEGVYIFDFFEKGGAEDHTYAVWGKPAFPLLKAWYAIWRRPRRSGDHRD